MPSPLWPFHASLAAVKAVTSEGAVGNACAGGAGAAAPLGERMGAWAEPHCHPAGKADLGTRQQQQAARFRTTGILLWAELQWQCPWKTSQMPPQTECRK